MSAPSLTVPAGQAYVVPHGLGRPQLEAHRSRANRTRGFFVQNGKSYGRSMWEGATPAGPLAGRPTRMESPTLLVGGARLSQPQLEDIIMATNATPTGENRPKSLVTLSTLEKRIRRHLAADYLQLRKNRRGTYQFNEHGEWSVIEPRNHVLMRRRFTLEELGRELGVLAEHETVAAGREAGHE